MTVEMIVKFPGLLKAEGFAGVVVGNGLNAIVVSKAIVITDGDVTEWLSDEAEYVISNVESDWCDETVDLEVPKGADKLGIFRAAVRLALLAGEPGPVAAQWLEPVAEDLETAEARFSYAKTLSHHKVVAAAEIKKVQVTVAA